MSNDSATYKAREEDAKEAVRTFAVDQFARWKAAREGQGNRVAADGVQPLPTSPDIYREFDELPEETNTFLFNLAHKSRLATLQGLSDQQYSAMVVAAVDGQPMDSNLKESIAESLHEGWLQTRQDMGLSGHWGDKPWDELPETAKDNDRVLVEPLGLQMAGYAQSDDPAHKAILQMVDKAHLTIDSMRDAVNNPVHEFQISSNLVENIDEYKARAAEEIQRELGNSKDSSPNPK